MKAFSFQRVFSRWLANGVPCHLVTPNSLPCAREVAETLAGLLVPTRDNPSQHGRDQIWGSPGHVLEKTCAAGLALGEVW